jgi:hypothetical protein
MLQESFREGGIVKMETLLGFILFALVMIFMRLGDIHNTLVKKLDSIVDEIDKGNTQ